MSPEDTDLSRYYAAVLTMLRRVVDDLRRPPGAAARTSDIVQETFLRLVPQLADGERPEDLIPLAATVARRFLIDAARRRSPHLVPQEVLDGALRTLGETTGVEALDLEEYLEALEPAARRVVELRLFAGLSLAEIEQASGATEYFVKTTLKAAWRDLARRQRSRS